MSDNFSTLYIHREVFGFIVHKLVSQGKGGRKRGRKTKGRGGKGRGQREEGERREKQGWREVEGRNFVQL